VSKFSSVTTIEWTQIYEPEKFLWVAATIIATMQENQA